MLSSIQQDIKPHSQMIININRSSKIHGNRSHSREQKKLTMLAYMHVIYACIFEWALVVQ